MKINLQRSICLLLVGMVMNVSAQSLLDNFPLILSAHNPMVVLGQDGMLTQPEDLYSNIDWLEGSGVIFMLNVFTNCPQWPGKIDHRSGVPWPDREMIIDASCKQDLRYPRRMMQVMNQRILDDYGTDPVNLLSQRAQEKNVPFFVKFRMNDHHMVRRKQRNSYYDGYFWMEHVATRDHDHFDYREAEVRTYFLDLMEEVLRMYPVIEGFEMDFMRSPHYFSEVQVSDLELMNQFMMQAREIVETIKRESDRDLVLGGERENIRTL